MKTNKTNQQGFSLIELLVVVVIIGIIAAIAIPSLLASRRAANEANAVASTRTILSANATYQASVGGGDKYAPDLAALSAAPSKLIDTSLSGATTAATAKTGYFYTYVAAGTPVGTTFTMTVTPTGTFQKSYFTDESGVIRFADAGTDGAAAAASATSTPIGGTPSA